MIELRLHGRGGQGAVTSAELIAQTSIRVGRFAQAFPSFGPERRGAPVMAYARLSEERIRIRSAVYEPDIVLVLDASLLSIVDVTSGLKKGGLVVVNSTQPAKDVREKLKVRSRLAVVDALGIAMHILKRPIANTTLMGALNKAANLGKNEDFHECIKDRFGRLAARNIDSFNRAYELTEILEA